MPGTHWGQCWGLESLFSLPPRLSCGGGGHTHSHPSSLGGGSPAGKRHPQGLSGLRPQPFSVAARLACGWVPGAVSVLQLKDFHSVFQMVIEDVPELEG